MCGGGGRMRGAMPPPARNGHAPQLMYVYVPPPGVSPAAPCPPAPLSSPCQRRLPPHTPPARPGPSPPSAHLDALGCPPPLPTYTPWAAPPSPLPPAHLHALCRREERERQLLQLLHPVAATGAGTSRAHLGTRPGPVRFPEQQQQGRHAGFGVSSCASPHPTEAQGGSQQVRQ